MDSLSLFLLYMDVMLFLFSNGKLILWGSNTTKIHNNFLINLSYDRGLMCPPFFINFFLKISPLDQTLRPTFKFLILGIFYHVIFFLFIYLVYKFINIFKLIFLMWQFWRNFMKLYIKTFYILNFENFFCMVKYTQN